MSSRHDGYEISDDKDRLDLDVIHDFLANESYWAKGRSRATVEGTVAHSMCFGVYAPDGAQAGFARLVTDRTTIAHLNDVFILPAHRGRGLAKALVGFVLGHPELTTVRRWTLSTRDAHALYAAFGFGPMLMPEIQMMRMLDDLAPSA